MSQMTLFDCIDDVMLEAARLIAGQSDDPSTKVGCVLVQDGEVIGRGYNRFPRGVQVNGFRLSNRNLKLEMTVHAEINALLDAGLDGMQGFVAYLHPFPPCARCAGVLIEAGCTRVVAPYPTPQQAERWGESFQIMQSMLYEAGVTLDLLN